MKPRQKKSHTSVMWTPIGYAETMFNEGTGRLTSKLPRCHARAVSVTIKPLTKKQTLETFGP